MQQLDKNGQVFYSGIEQLTVNRLPLAVFPNPVKNAVHIAGINGNKAEIMIYDVAGKLVYQNKNYSAADAIATDAWSKGTYMVRLKDNDGWKASSFEKE